MIIFDSDKNRGKSGWSISLNLKPDNVFCRDTQASRTCHLKEGLHQLLCLVPYEVVSVEIWEHIMPRWLEAIVKDVAPREMHHLKLLLRYILGSRVTWRCRR